MALTYNVTDGIANVAASQSFNLAAVNDAPIAVTDNYTMAEDGAALDEVEMRGPAQAMNTVPTGLPS